MYRVINICPVKPFNTETVVKGFMNKNNLTWLVKQQHMKFYLILHHGSKVVYPLLINKCEIHT